MITRLMQFVSQLFRSSPVSSEPERDRPLEQIINEGSLGEIEDKGNFENCFAPKEKTQLEKDIDKFLSIASNDIVVMSEEKFKQVTAGFLNPATVWGLRRNPNLILVPGVVNIGIVKG